MAWNFEENKLLQNALAEIEIFDSYKAFGEYVNLIESSNNGSRDNIREEEGGT